MSYPSDLHRAALVWSLVVGGCQADGSSGGSTSVGSWDDGDAGGSLNRDEDGSPTGDGAASGATAGCEGWECNWREGERLRSRVATTPGGAQMLVGWYDSVLEADCQFADTADGALRCLPAFAYRLRGPLHYVEPTCSGTPLSDVSLPSQCQADAFVAAYGVDQCGRIDEVFEIAEGPLLPDPIYTDDDCSERGLVNNAGLVRLGSPIPLDTFVAATVSVE